MAKDRFVAKQWVDGEVDVMMDGYKNTEAYAMVFVMELLRGNEYEHLTNTQRDAAIAYLEQRQKGGQPSAKA